LTLCKLVEFVWCWINKFGIAQTDKTTCRGCHIVSDWFNLCQNFAEQFRKCGKGLIVLIYKSYQNNYKKNTSTTEENTPIHERTQLGDDQNMSKLTHFL